MFEHGDRRILDDRPNQAFAAAGDDQVDVSIELQQERDQRAVGRLDQLHCRRIDLAPCASASAMIAADRAIGMNRFLSAAQDDGVAALDAEGGGVAGDVGPALVEKQHDAQRHAHLLDAKPIGPNIPFDDLPDRIDLRRDLLDAARPSRRCASRRASAAPPGAGASRLFGRGDVLRIRRRSVPAPPLESIGDPPQGRRAGLAAQRRQLLRRPPGGCPAFRRKTASLPWLDCSRNLSRRAWQDQRTWDQPSPSEADSCCSHIREGVLSRSEPLSA